MPSFRNGLVLELARGVRGFLNLEVGLTRCPVPGTEALGTQVKQQQRKPATSQEQLEARETKTQKDPLQIAPQKADRIGIFRDMLGILPTGRLLDLACGHGKFSLAARDLGWEVTAVDVRTDRMPEESGIEWVQSDVRDFEIEQDKYDCISVLGLLYHLELEDQLRLLRSCAGTPTIVDTHVTRMTDYEKSGYLGTLFEEAPWATPEQRAEIATASWGNETSFWPTEESLMRMFHDSGFAQVFRLIPSGEKGRVFYLCFGDPENAEERGPEEKSDTAVGQAPSSVQQDEKLMPPEAEIFPGDASNFERVGQIFLDYFKDLGGLKPDDHVLDVGCGIGRMAIPLTGYLNSSGSYEGFDVVPRGIEWCRNNITPQYPNFRFQVSNVYNQRYNPRGEYQASEYRFPYEDRVFDFVFFASVFTHLLPEDVDNYLYETSRTLKPGGKCLISYFLLNEESLSLIEEGRSAYNFKHGSGVHRFADPERPEFAVAYDENYILGLYEKHGFTVRVKPGYGSWCGRKESLGYQDILVAEKD